MRFRLDNFLKGTQSHPEHVSMVDPDLFRGTSNIKGDQIPYFHRFSPMELDPTGEHSNANVGLRTGTWLFFPERDPGNYVGTHRCAIDLADHRCQGRPHMVWLGAYGLTLSRSDGSYQTAGVSGMTW